jgi:hypothetical protein
VTGEKPICKEDPMDILTKNVLGCKECALKARASLALLHQFCQSLHRKRLPQAFALLHGAQPACQPPMRIVLTTMIQQLDNYDTAE